MLTVILLTRDEEVHIARAIRSVQNLAERIVVVDSGSSDKTCDIAQQLGATVLKRPWRNYADQFNWALDQVVSDADWVLRLDADEIVSATLVSEIRNRLRTLDPDVAGVYVPRYMNFLGGPVRRGGLFPVQVLRLFRAGAGQCENRWMDEHIRVKGHTVRFAGHILDDNLKPLTWWVGKHDAYASREVVDLLNLKHGFLPRDSIADIRAGQAGRKRWIKENIYAHLPAGLRAAAYFLWRYIIRLGVLDSPQGRRFHRLQGFWYRRLVDVKLRKVQTHMRRHAVDPPTAIQAVLDIDVT